MLQPRFVCHQQAVHGKLPPDLAHYTVVHGNLAISRILSINLGLGSGVSHLFGVFLWAARVVGLAWEQ